MGAPRCGAWRHSTLGETRRIRRNVSNCVERTIKNYRVWISFTSENTVTRRAMGGRDLGLAYGVFSVGYGDGQACEWRIRRGAQLTAGPVPPVSDFGTTCSRATTDVPCGRWLDAEGKQFNSPGRLAR